MFPGPHAVVITNDDGEPIGWDYPSDPDPNDFDDYDRDVYDHEDDEEDDEEEDEE